MKEHSIIHPIKVGRNRKPLFLASIFIVLSVIFGAHFLNNTVKPVNMPEVLGISQARIDFKSPPESFELTSAKWVPQTFNNCGPAATAMVLQYFGYNISQEETKSALRTSPDDKNVFIGEISNYLKNDFGIENKVLFNGDIKTIKTLVSNGIYVVVEDWLHPNEDIGHVLIIRGFDDKEGVFIADDSYFGVGIKYPYQIWDEKQWKPYNREYMPVYRKEKEELVKSIIGENWYENTMYKNSIKRNLADTNSNSNDMYAYFNLGTSYFALSDYENAKTAFEKSRAIGWPHRMLWYNIDPIKNYNKLGEYDKAIELSNLALWYNDSFAEVHYEMAVSYKGLGQMDKAKVEIDKTLEFDPGNKGALSFKETLN